MIAVLTWPEWLWAGVPMFFVGWYGCEVFRAWERRQFKSEPRDLNSGAPNASGLEERRR